MKLIIVQKILQEPTKWTFWPGVLKVINCKTAQYR